MSLPHAYPYPTFTHPPSSNRLVVYQPQPYYGIPSHHYSESTLSFRPVRVPIADERAQLKHASGSCVSVTHAIHRLDTGFRSPLHSECTNASCRGERNAFLANVGEELGERALETNTTTRAGAFADYGSPVPCLSNITAPRSPTRTGQRLGRVRRVRLRERSPVTLQSVRFGKRKSNSVANAASALTMTMGIGAPTGVASPGVPRSSTALSGDDAHPLPIEPTEISTALTTTAVGRDDDSIRTLPFTGIPVQSSSMVSRTNSTECQTSIVGSQVMDYVSSLRAFDISSDLTVGRLRASGGFADVYEGQLTVKKKHTMLSSSSLHEHVDDERKSVAVKRFRVFLESDRDFAKAIEREVRIWSGLEHANILPLLGYVALDDLPSLVSEWMDNGTLTQYLKVRPEVKAFPMTQGIAAGLAYLHAKGVVHGDLRCDNILVSPDGRPLLCDFGISRLLANSVTIAGTDKLKGSLRWMAIELLDIEEDPSALQHPLHTKASDVWAYGMVIYELLSGKVPFYQIRADGLVICAITSGRHPAKPNKWRDESATWLWDVCVRCWAKVPGDRPKMEQLCM